MVKLVEEPEREAVMMAEPAEEMALAEMGKEAELESAGTVTEAGTVRRAVLEERETETPPAGAALLRVTVQEPASLEEREVGLQERLEGAMPVTKFKEKVTEEPEREAVMMAVALAVMLEAVAEKVADEAPAATVTEAGTDRAALLSDRVMTVPPAGAAPLRLTVQVEVPEPAMLVGVQFSPDRVVVGGRVIVPVVPRDVMKSPAEDEAKLLLTSTTRLGLVLEDNVKVTLATTPLGMAVEFAPANRHVIVPAAGLQ
jgi:hypothetical protein